MCDYRKIGHFTKNLYGNFSNIFLPYKNFFNDYKKLGKDGVWYMPQSGEEFKLYISSEYTRFTDKDLKPNLP